MTALRNLLDSYRKAARTERDKGKYFERVAVAFLTHDPVQIQQYETVQTYKDWAAAHGWDGRDTGIYLVAKLRGEEGFAAIQCKFYDSQHRIQKADIQSRRSTQSGLSFSSSTYSRFRRAVARISNDSSRICRTTLIPASLRKKPKWFGKSA